MIRISSGTPPKRFHFSRSLSPVKSHTARRFHVFSNATSESKENSGGDYRQTCADRLFSHVFMGVRGDARVEGQKRFVAGDQTKGPGGQPDRYLTGRTLRFIRQL